MMLPERHINREGECWLWTGPKDKNGYGLTRVDGVTARVPRVAYKQYFGEIPMGLHVLHTCDQPSCIRPEHLRLGTHKQNMADMVAKGRAHRPLGELNGRAKLTEEKVSEVRKRLEAGVKPDTVAAQLNIPRGTVHHIAAGRTW